MSKIEKAAVTREHRERAYLVVEEVNYAHACPDGKAYIDGAEVIGDYSFENSLAQAIADAEARGRAEPRSRHATKEEEQP